MMASIFNHLWQSTLFAAVVALLCVACRHNRARLRYGLWFVASAKFLVPFALLAAAGGLLEWQQAPPTIRSVVASPGVRDFNAPFAAMWLDSTTTVTAAAHARWIAPLLVGIWLCGFTAIAFRRANQYREVRAAVRASTPWKTAAPGLRQGSGGQALPVGIEIRDIEIRTV